ncbi:MAG: LemA family protein [Firmicutes bacterium]|uniref:LemA family protein n=1 Tax=Candidatus Gallilactobacillus intestinavium TaxID=2840838 RepID=A0A9D9E6R3_9LACO|nr:LemA family protein [Candidatus Gallilactobacillus intestinavium]
MTTIIILIVIVLLVILYISLYNSLVKLKTYTQESWSQIDVQLKRRNDLIPNLLETVKGYSHYEKDTLSQIVNLRNKLINNNTDRKDTMKVSDELSNSLKSIFALSENYPDLKADAEYQKLMEELTNTENKIAYSRQLYNSSVANFNMKIQTFPTSIVAKIHHFTPATYLETSNEEKSVPNISFNEENN